MRIPYALAVALVVPSALLGAQRPVRDPAAVWQHLSQQYDKDRDGRITKEEHGRGDRAFANLDRDADGVVTLADLQRRPQRPAGPRPERGAQRQAPPEVVALPKVGDVAPDFELPLLERTPAEGERSDPAAPPRTIRLSSFAGRRPVALIFGSYT